MIDLLRLLFAFLASLFKSRAQLEVENLVLRQQIGVLRRRVPKRPALTNIDSPGVRLALSLVPHDRRRPCDCQAGDSHSLASAWLPGLLDRGPPPPMTVSVASLGAGEFFGQDRCILCNLNHGPAGNGGGVGALNRHISRRKQMSSTSDKVKGTANQVAGKVKQGVGEATDDPALKGEGKVQEAKGDLQKAVGNAKSAIKKAADL
jgi:uncharacterized protein YjbJ (UPF0337 family)